MYKNRESYFYLLIGISLFISSFFPFDFLDIRIGTETIFLNCRALLILIGFFLILFPPSEPIRISSFGKWIIDLVKSMKGDNYQRGEREDFENPSNEDRC